MTLFDHLNPTLIFIIEPSTLKVRLNFARNIKRNQNKRLYVPNYMVAGENSDFFFIMKPEKSRVNYTNFNIKFKNFEFLALKFVDFGFPYFIHPHIGNLF